MLLAAQSSQGPPALPMSHMLLRHYCLLFLNAKRISGSSAAMQANFLQVGIAMVDRGYSVIVYEGPGQGEVRNCKMR